MQDVQIMGADALHSILNKKLKNNEVILFFLLYCCHINFLILKVVKAFGTLFYLNISWV